MFKDENDLIIKEELEAIRDEILALYNSSSKKTSGNFEEQLTTSYEPNRGILEGVMYLGGRKPGKRPPISAIEDWIIRKGLSPIEKNITTSQLAFLIARKIGEKGTRKENHLYVYEEIITPQRIDSIIDRLSVLNADLFVDEVVIMIEKVQEQILL